MERGGRGEKGKGGVLRKNMGRASLRNSGGGIHKWLIFCWRMVEQVVLKMMKNVERGCEL